VSQVGPGRLDRGLVDPPQVVGGQRRPGAPWDAVAAPGPGQDQILRSGSAGELAGDCLADPLTHGHHSHAGPALWFGLEAAAEAAGLIAHFNDLDAAQLGNMPSILVNGPAVNPQKKQ
jgi:hypothetical protein